MSKRTIPVVDLSKFVNGGQEEKKAFVEELGKAFHEVGFVGVVNHGVPKEVVDAFMMRLKASFPYLWNKKGLTCWMDLLGSVVIRPLAQSTQSNPKWPISKNFSK